jgi:hypothetical protein
MSEPKVSVEQMKRASPAARNSTADHHQRRRADGSGRHRLGQAHLCVSLIRGASEGRAARHVSPELAFLIEQG